MANSEAKREATGPVISGGHLVAKALKNEGVEVIWTLCGGHIIDIYDGCIDEASRSSTCAMNRSPRMRRTAIRGRAAKSAV
jgi:acetolactate synthase-1/2/3 large subunit